MKTAEMQVDIVAATVFVPPEDVPWKPAEEDPDGCALIEFAGRACYQSWKRPNPSTATNTGYINHILSVRHFSVLEHASVSFYIRGVSRSLTHELVRHRHFSYSQLSQRYVPEGKAAMVVPPDIKGEADLERWFEANADGALGAYNILLAALQEKFQHILDLTVRRKRARQAARSVLPNATETALVMTGNYRAWRHFLALRATEHADVEIRALAIQILRLLHEVAPAVFGDFKVLVTEDGDEIARSKYAPEE